MLVQFDNGLELRGTKEHPFYVQDKGWVPLGELSIGDVCFDREQNPVTVKNIVRDGQIVEVFNIEVEDAHTYYIGKDGLEVLVHNWCLFGEDFVMPWDPDASFKLRDNLGMYGKMGKRAVVGTASGAASGAVTGAGTGAVVGGIGGGVVTGGAGILPGAGAGAAVAGGSAGAISGGITGFIRAAMASPNESSTRVALDSCIGGGVAGVGSGILAPLSGASATFYASGTTSVMQGGGAVALEQVPVSILTVTVTTEASVGLGLTAGFVEMSARGQYRGWDEGGWEDYGDFKQCFLHGTKISRFSPDSSNQYELTEIEEIKTDDLVWACDPLTGEWAPKPVVRTMRHEYSGDVITVITEDGDRIEATRNHPFWVVSGKDLVMRPCVDDVSKQEREMTPHGRWVESGDLQVGDVLWGRQQRVKITAIDVHQEQTTVYNIEVAELHSYAVGDTEVLVHNKQGDKQSLERIQKLMGLSNKQKELMHEAMYDIGKPQGASMTDEALIKLAKYIKKTYPNK